MKHFCLACPFLIGVILSPLAARGEDYSHFAALPELTKDKIVWDLHEHHTWGLPEQKPVCRDLLEHQGYSFANNIAWTLDAIDLAESKGWKDLNPLIEKIYDRPHNIWVCERAFRYLRAVAGKKISAKLVAAAQTLARAGAYHTDVTDAQLSAASDLLRHEPDKEAVLVYTLNVACWHAGKGGTDRGRKAAADIIKMLAPDAVAHRINQLRNDATDSVYSDEIEWLARYLNIKPGEPHGAK